MKNRNFFSFIPSFFVGLVLLILPSMSFAGGHSLDELIAAAQKEGEVATYWHSSRMGKKVAKAFEEKYGVKVLATKMKDSEMTERIVREVSSGNVIVDLVGYDDGPMLDTVLTPQGFVENYVPPFLINKIPQNSRNPLIYLWQPFVFGYNSETYGNNCPIKSLWQLTEKEWSGRFHMWDPRIASSMLQMFSAMEDRSEDLIASYKKHYGKDLKLTEANAGLEFVKRLAANKPILYNEDYEIAVAVGTRGQDKAPIGIYSLGRHRENKKKNLALALCDVDPFKGLNQPTYMQIVKGAPHPNAAKLLAYYVLTQEGANPWVGVVGAYSSNSSLGSSPDNPYPTAEAWDGTLLISNNTNVAKRRQFLMDFWIKHSN